MLEGFTGICLHSQVVRLHNEQILRIAQDDIVAMSSS